MNGTNLMNRGSVLKCSLYAESGENAKGWFGETLRPQGLCVDQQV
jgi:hypothetical protein